MKEKKIFNVWNKKYQLDLPGNAKIYKILWDVTFITLQLSLVPIVLRAQDLYTKGIISVGLRDFLMVSHLSDS